MAGPNAFLLPASSPREEGRKLVLQTSVTIAKVTVSTNASKAFYNHDLRLRDLTSRRLRMGILVVMKPACVRNHHH
jgi:hypothetical protein